MSILLFTQFCLSMDVGKECTHLFHKHIQYQFRNWSDQLSIYEQTEVVRRGKAKTNNFLLSLLIKTAH